MAVLVLLSLSGCGALDRATQREEARQLAWTGPGSGPCTFGGVTEAADAHCALLNFGTEGLLSAINDKVHGDGLPMACTVHVAAVEHELQRYPELRSVPVYTCPLASREFWQCHVSLIVTDPAGAEYVVDNGAVVSNTVGALGVATFSDFKAAVQDVLWIREVPTADEVAQAIPDFHPKLAYDFSFRH